MVIGPHHPRCREQPSTFLGDNCFCTSIVIEQPPIAVISDVIYHGVAHGVRWKSRYPVLTTPYVTYRLSWRRLGA